MSKEPEDNREDAEDEDDDRAPDSADDDQHEGSTDDDPSADDDQDEDDDGGDEEGDADEDDDGDADDEPDDEADDDGDADDEEEDDEPAPAKPAAKKKSEPKTIGKAAAQKRHARRRAPDKGSSMRNIILYIVVIGGIALAFAYLGQQDGGGGDVRPPPKWKEGDVVDVSITLVTTDVKDLACASEKELGGLHCGFADKRKPHPKGSDARTDETLLQPYTTTDQLQFLAAGMWQQAPIKAKLDKENWDNPSPRFSVNCKYKVAGKMSDAHIRWKPEGGWLADAASDWYAGSLSDCTIRQSGRAIPRLKKPTPAEPPADNPAEAPPADEGAK